MTEKQAVRALLLRIPERIHKKAKKFAKENGVTLTSLINQALAKYIDEPFTLDRDMLVDILIQHKLMISKIAELENEIRKDKLKVEE